MKHQGDLPCSDRDYARGCHCPGCLAAHQLANEQRKTRAGDRPAKPPPLDFEAWKADRAKTRRRMPSVPRRPVEVES